MGEPSGTPDEVDSVERDRGPTRADAVASRERILDAAAALAGDRRTSMIEIAAAAGVGRSTLYRHFSSRQALERALQQRATPPSGRIATLPFRAPGRLGREGPLALEVTHVLDEVPPHLVPDQLVAEARRAAGVAVALYVVDIDGSQLVRLAGSDNFPEELEAPPALGPEIVPEGLAAYETRLRQQLPGCVAEPLWLRGRVTALFLCIGTPVAQLEDIAKQGAAALELANHYTDFIEAARRRKPTTPAAEIQQTCSHLGSCGSPARSWQAGSCRPTKSVETGSTSSKTVMGPGSRSPRLPERARQSLGSARRCLAPFAPPDEAATTSARRFMR